MTSAPGRAAARSEPTFGDQLDSAVQRAGNPVLVGIDPHVGLLPEEFAAARDPEASRAERAAAVRSFCAELVDLCAGRVAAVKPQSAFFEVFGQEGLAVWESVVRDAHDAGLLVIGDVKRGDVPSTAAAYATAHLEGGPGADPRALCDAITVHPYLGEDSLAPFVETCRRTSKGAFVLVRTSNPGSSWLQLHGEPPVRDLVAAAVARIGEDLAGESGISSIGAVTGATHPGELADLRRLMPRAPLLLPGIGAQGARPEDVVPAFLPGGRGALVASSRGVAFAHRALGHSGKPWKDAARDALDETIAAVGSAIRSGEAAR